MGEKYFKVVQGVLIISFLEIVHQMFSWFY